MEKLGFGLDDDSSTSDQKQSNPQETRLLSIQRFIKYLTHAYGCKDANCRLLSCQRMKIVVQHIRGCKQKSNGGCPICKPFIALCCYHTKHCQEQKCAVPYCTELKNKQRKHQQRLRMAEILRRRRVLLQNFRLRFEELRYFAARRTSYQPTTGA